MGPFMVEIVFCRVTRRGRKLKKGMNKAGLANTRNDGPSQSFIPADDMVKITLDLSENGPVFSALDEMMMKMIDDDPGGGKKKSSSNNQGEAKKALKSLLKSGIPGIEKMFTPKGKKGAAKGFHKMTENSKKKFMKAIFGEDGTAIETGTAAALLAATCSGGDPEIGDKIAQLLIPELGDKVDPAMMAALMASSSMINAGASMEEVLKTMKAELIDSGMSEEEIFRKTQLLMQAFGKEESGSLAEFSLIGKQKNSALKRIEISPKDFAQIALLQRTIAACGSTPENVAKVIMIENQLSKRGAQNRHIADALKKLMDPGKGKKDTLDRLKKAMAENKMKKEDVQSSVRMHQAIENENEPTWKEVKAMKEILQGASPNSPEAIELNLARATKTAGISRIEFTQILVAQKAMASLGIDAKFLAQVMQIEKVIAENGVPAVEIARVLSDGGLPPDAHQKLVALAEEGLAKDFGAADVEAFVNLYDNMKLKSNIPEETIEHIDKTLIQVRCSLEDVADNLISSMSARGEKENVIVRNLCETLKDTGASVEIVGTTMMGSLMRALPKSEPDVMKDTGRSLTEVGFNSEEVQNTMTEILLNVLDEKPDLREEAVRAVEIVLKDAGQFPDQIRTHLEAVLPPEEKKMDPRLAEELERLRAQEEAREAGKAIDIDSDVEFDDDGRPIPKIVEPKNMATTLLDRNGHGSGASSRRGSSIGGSRRGSVSIGGTERRGSFYSDDVSKRSSVAIVVDDPENKKNMEKALNEVFDDESQNEGPDSLHPETNNFSPKVNKLTPNIRNGIPPPIDEPGPTKATEALISEKKKLLDSLSGQEKASQLALIESLEKALVGGPSGAIAALAHEKKKLDSLSGPERAAQLALIQSLEQAIVTCQEGDTILDQSFEIQRSEKEKLENSRSKQNGMPFLQHDQKNLSPMTDHQSIAGIKNYGSSDRRWREILFSMSGVKEEDLSIDVSADLLDKEHIKIETSSEIEKNRLSKNIESVRLGILTEVIMEEDNLDRYKDSFLKLIKRKGVSSEGENICVANISPLSKIRLQALMIRSRTLCRINIESITSQEILDLLHRTVQKPCSSEAELAMMAGTVTVIRKELLLNCISLGIDFNADFAKCLMNIDIQGILQAIKDLLTLIPFLNPYLHVVEKLESMKDTESATQILSIVSKANTGSKDTADQLIGFISNDQDLSQEDTKAILSQITRSNVENTPQNEPSGLTGKSKGKSQVPLPQLKIKGIDDEHSGTKNTVGEIPSQSGSLIQNETGGNFEDTRSQRTDIVRTHNAEGGKLSIASGKIGQNQDSILGLNAGEQISLDSNINTTELNGGRTVLGTDQINHTMRLRQNAGGNAPNINTNSSYPSSDLGSNISGNTIKDLHSHQSSNLAFGQSEQDTRSNISADSYTPDGRRVIKRQGTGEILSTSHRSNSASALPMGESTDKYRHYHSKTLTSQERAPAIRDLRAEVEILGNKIGLQTGSGLHAKTGEDSNSIRYDLNKHTETSITDEITLRDRKDEGQYKAHIPSSPIRSSDGYTHTNLGAHSTSSSLQAPYLKSTNEFARGVKDGNDNLSKGNYILREEISKTSVGEARNKNVGGTGRDDTGSERRSFYDKGNTLYDRNRKNGEEPAYPTTYDHRGDKERQSRYQSSAYDFKRSDKSFGIEGRQSRFSRPSMDRFDHTIPYKPPTRVDSNEKVNIEHGNTEQTDKADAQILDTNSILFNSILRRVKAGGANGNDYAPSSSEFSRESSLEHRDQPIDCDELLQYILSDPEAAKDLASTIEQSGLSEKEIQKLMEVFTLDGKIHHIGGVSKFRTSDHMKDVILGTEGMFDKALTDAKTQIQNVKNIGISDESRALMQKILNSKNQNDEISTRVSTFLAGTGLTTTKGVKIQKRDDVELVEYSAHNGDDSRLSVRRTKRVFDTPDEEPEETYRHPASLGIGVIGTGNQRLVRRNIKRHPSRYKPLEDQREATAMAQDDHRRITGLRRAKVPLMVYSCGGFTRCYRIARFHTVEGPPIGVKYGDNLKSGGD